MNELIGKKVIIFSTAGQAERQDIGILISVETPWVCIRKGEHDFHYFSAYQIRVVKAFEA